MVQRMMNYIILKSQILVCDLSTMQNSVNYINTFPSNASTTIFKCHCLVISACILYMNEL
jgi:hypothetical protein